jgi:hypothetical protein
MTRVDTIVVNEQKIFVIDYRGGKEREMIEAVIELGNLIATNTEPVLVLSVFDDKTYVTPNFMRQVEKETAKVIHLIDKVAFLGLSSTKRIILNGYNLFFQRNFQAFKTREEAIEYLLDKTRK